MKLKSKIIMLIIALCSGYLIITPSEDKIINSIKSGYSKSIKNK